MVTAYYSDTLSIKDKVKVGDIISKINGQKVEDLVKQKLPFTPASNYPTQLRDLARTLLRSIPLKILPNYLGSQSIAIN